MLSTRGPAATREIMDMQEFQFPKLFKEKSSAVTFLQSNGLWVLHPGLWVSSMVDPKLKVPCGPGVYRDLCFHEDFVVLSPSKHD